MLSNPVLWAVMIMLGLSLARVHVVLSLMIGAIVGGLLSGLPLVDVKNAQGELITSGVLSHFQQGLSNGAEIALSYALLGAFAMAISYSGLPKMLASHFIHIFQQPHGQKHQRYIKFGLFIGLILISCFSQNLIPIHIAFIPLIIPPLLSILNQLNIDRRLIACLITFGLVNTYMFIPYGFGDIYSNQIVLKNVADAGLNVQNIWIMQAMAIPALGMVFGLLTAMFVSYRKPRTYQNLDVHSQQLPTQSSTQAKPDQIDKFKSLITLSAVVVAFLVQIYTNSLILGALFGFGVFMATGVVKWKDADHVFEQGIKLMAMIGFVMITAKGFAQVMTATGQIQPLVDASIGLFGDSKALAAFIMLLIGLIVTMGIGSSFSTVPIIATIYVPICMSMGFSPLATVAIIGTAGALGDAGSPASDSTLGPTMGLNIDGQHHHIKDTVIPTFLHYNLPLLIFGWVAAMVL